MFIYSRTILKRKNKIKFLLNFWQPAYIQKVRKYIPHKEKGFEYEFYLLKFSKTCIRPIFPPLDNGTLFISLFKSMSLNRLQMLLRTPDWEKRDPSSLMTRLC